MTTVQEYIRELLEDFQPTSAHALMSSFRWDCLATTNYDLLVEKAYAAQGKKAVQMPIPFIENGDRVEDRLKDSRGVMYLKLHGCITRTTNESCPLILTTDQYIESMKGRSRIFEHLKTKAFERTVIFVGYSLQDTNMRSILLELAKLGDKRPRYFLVGPHFDDVQRRFWETKRITPIEGTFDSFMKTLDEKITSPFRGLAVAPSARLPIAERFAKRDVTLTQNCLQFLENHAEYVKGATATEKLNPTDFYRGENLGWSAIEQGLDCRRQLADVLLSEHFIDSGSSDEMEVILVKGYAGAGKTVLLRCVAWDASHEYNMLCLYMQPSGIINAAAIQEIIIACDERVFLFVDNPLDRIRELQSLMAEVGPQGKKLTVVLTARLNEWNVHGTALARFVSTEYDLLYLTAKEADSLIGLLEKHRSLGTLEKASPEERKEAFGDRAGRQLLVALHEATLGKPFEEIVENEYRNITPHEAQKLYLSICVLNRQDIRVRAGLISRTHNIPFEEFRDRLFKPLEHVVKAEMDRNIRDYVYEARHPHIAEIVFERVLKTQEQRYEEYIRAINGMNIDYSSDRKAFNHMTRERAVLDTFQNHELARLIYQAAQEMAGEDAHLLHQMGIYEMIRPNGNLSIAQKHLLKAHELFPKSTNIKHSIAEYHLRMADGARSELEQAKHLDETVKLCQELKRYEVGVSYAHHTLVKVGIRQLRTLLDTPDRDSLPSEFEEVIKRTEGNLFDGLQQLPGDSYLLSAESELAELLNQEKRALSALEKAFAANHRSTILARRLASCYELGGKLDKARETIELALKANNGDRKLHYLYSKLLMQIPETKPELITYHLRKSFAPGDRNFDARILYGRQLYIDGKFDECKQFFRTLAATPIPLEFRMALLYPIEREFTGRVFKIEHTHCFVRRDGPGDSLFAHQLEAVDDTWTRLSYGVKVAFKVAFNFKGPTAQEIRVLEG